ncbi:formate dehydrogenase accessory sulfurtransferase FdhD [Paenibacillus sp.]|uniref:formate dehydrogenase accessory sulfurtransferase FdhD n=1 Tax=Paenibacillus sp. TaxID=58172 RepID=UPI002D67E479|nr:formate dehydrogenase accessory sulfurtransferase FdhD [Paenibacillus sp.]HZG57842.1 formate dehydrogenase accessory sulfurtransferase FdhD [Paenibacillus sp.]
MEDWGKETAASRPVVRYDVAAGFREETDWVAVERALTIVLDGEEFATMVCTPSDLEELVYGFLASEGIVRRADEVASLAIDAASGFARVELRNPRAAGKDAVSKRFIGSCCGKSRQFYFVNDARAARTSTSEVRLTVRQCVDRLRELQDASEAFRRTGGLHNAALCTPERILLQRADIGRHNALDKVYGRCLLDSLPTRDAIVAFSGRLSSEVVLKVAKLGAAVVLSKSAPTTLALELAHDLGITAVGFIRGDSLNVYTHARRIVAD